MSDSSNQERLPFWTVLPGPIMYFGVKYLVFKGQMSGMANVALLLGSFLLIMAVRKYYQSKQAQ
ncbi:MAG: hypothetical protein AAGF87_18850 [Bacteroidota bacterium]